MIHRKLEGCSMRLGFNWNISRQFVLLAWCWYNTRTLEQSERMLFVSFRAKRVRTSVTRHNVVDAKLRMAEEVTVSIPALMALPARRDELQKWYEEFGERNIRGGRVERIIGDCGYVIRSGSKSCD